MVFQVSKTTVLIRFKAALKNNYDARGRYVWRFKNSIEVQLLRIWRVVLYYLWSLIPGRVFAFITVRQTTIKRKLGLGSRLGRI